MFYKKPLLTPEQKRKFENLEIINESGQEDEQKAISAIKVLSRQWEFDQAQKKADILGLLDSRKKYNDYIKLLAKITAKLIEEQDINKDIDWHVFYTLIGIIIDVYYKGRFFRRAFKACRKPIYDLNACERFARAVADLKINYGQSIS